MKGMTKWLALAASSALLSGCFAPQLSITPNEELTDYIVISVDELEQLMEDDADFMIVKSLSTCIYCQQLKPIMTEFVQNESLPIYSITIYSIAEENHPETTPGDYQTISSLLEGNSYPTMYVVDNGDVVAYGGVGGYTIEQFTETVLRYID